MQREVWGTTHTKGCIPQEWGPQVQWITQNHRKDTPIRPIRSGRVAVTYGVAKELANILRPLVGQSLYHIRNTQDFVE